MSEYMSFTYTVDDLDDGHQQRMSRLLMWMTWDPRYAKEVLRLVLDGVGSAEALSKYEPGEYYPYDDEEDDQL